MPARQLGLVSFGIAAVTLLLVVVNAVLVVRNQGIEAQVQQRQIVINQSVQINQVSNAMLQMLGQAVVQSQDQEISALLSEFGVTLTPPSAPAPAAVPSPAAPSNAP